MEKSLVLTLQQITIDPEFVESDVQIRVDLFIDPAFSQFSQLKLISETVKFDDSFNFNGNILKHADYILIIVSKFDQDGNQISTLAGSKLKLANFPWNSTESINVDCNPPNDPGKIAGTLSFFPSHFLQKRHPTFLKVFLNLAGIEKSLIEKNTKFQVEMFFFGSNSQVTAPQILAENPVFNSTHIFNYSEGDLLKAFYITFYKLDQSGKRVGVITRNAVFTFAFTP